MDFVFVPLAGLLIYIASQAQKTPPPPPAQERVALLPDADGAVGAVIVQTTAGEQLLDKAYATAVVDPKTGAIVLEQQTETAVRLRYSGALMATPPRPRTFIVSFEYDSATEFAATARPLLDELKAFIAKHPAPEILVVGHTDSMGRPEYNDQLSLERAETVRKLLVEVGIQAVGMEVVGRGERDPLVPTADEVREERNRRVEIIVR